MSLFKKIQEKIIPVATTEPVVAMQPPPSIKHEFVNFSRAYRVGILAEFESIEQQNTINEYKKKIDHFGYESDVLLFVDKKEKDNTIFLQSYDWNDLDKKTMLPYSPRTDRFIVKRFDILINLYSKPIPSLMYISRMSHAKCRVGLFVEKLYTNFDLLIPIENNLELNNFINCINTILDFKPYERKTI